MADDLFGASVAIDGDTAVVGADGRDRDKGAVFVFERSGGAWTQKIRLLDATGATGDEFGNSVAIWGDKIIAGAPFSDGTGGAPLTPAAIQQGAALFFINVPLAPTAAGVSVSGRVLTPDGRGLRNARVSLTDSAGAMQTAMTNSFGYYRFNEIGAGQTIIVSVASKRYQFPALIVSVNEEITDLNFIGEK
jgi:hypothetical protein